MPDQPRLADASRELRVFIVAGEHSGDALGAGLMAALVRAHAGPVRFAGVGGERMSAEGLDSIYPLAEIAVMGPIAILKRLRAIVRRAYQTIDAAISFAPDVLVIIDAPEFTHAVAKRVRRHDPSIPIVNYVSPTVWAWRPGRARVMRAYVDHLMALLPFEPAAHARLGGPLCTYVGHPLVERLEWLAGLDPAPLRDRLGIAAGAPVLVLLPGSRRSEVARLIDVFGATVGRLAAAGHTPELVMPVVPSVRSLIEASISGWPCRPHLVEGEDDKWLSFKLARAALAASGTVTLELAAAGAPMVVAYKVEPLVAPLLRRMIKGPSVVLANLVLGETAFPEYLQQDCTPNALAAALTSVLNDGPAREHQLAALARIGARLAVPFGSPSSAAAAIVLTHARHRFAGGEPPS